MLLPLFLFRNLFSVYWKNLWSVLSPQKHVIRVYGMKAIYNLFGLATHSGCVV